jgi:hypothetical protein
MGSNLLSKLVKRAEKYGKLLKIITLVLMICIPSIIGIYYIRFVHTSYLDGLSLEYDSAFLILNQSRWVTPSFQAENFMFETESYETNNPIRANVTKSVDYYQMGTTDWFKANSTNWGEWGYSFHNLKNGTFDGAGLQHWGGYPTTPASKQDAYEYMKQYVLNITSRLNNNTRPWISFNGHYPYHHYAAEFGFDAIGTEIGENIASHQLRLAFNRGAARQYHLPWFVDVSAWYGSGITDYNSPSVWDVGGPKKGHSLSMFQRMYYLGYMAGASRVIAEGGCFNLFYRTPNEQGILPLTPLGEVARDFVHFTDRHPDRGIPYSPIGIFLDEYHGLSMGGSKPGPFDVLAPSKGDKMNYFLFDLLFPGCWNHPELEAGAMVNTEFGDIFDVLLQNATADVLASYPVLLMSGELNLRSKELANLIHYVKNGGTLLVNSAYFNMLNQELKNQGETIRLALPTFRSSSIIPMPSGKGGNFILYGGDYSVTLLHPLLRELIPHLSPFSLSSSGPLGSKQGSWGAPVHIEYLLNQNERGFVLTLINNDGITKEFDQDPKLNPKEAKQITIELQRGFLEKCLQGAKLQSVTNWMTDSVVWQRSAQDEYPKLTVWVNPGEIQILEFFFDV